MYKSIMTLILSASIAIASSQPAYKADQVIPLDLLSVAGPFPGNFNIKKNVRIRYKIDNINRNVYTVSVNSESKSFFQEKPPIFGVISDIDLSKLAPVLPVHPAAAAGTPLGVLKARATAVPEAQIIANYEAAKTNVNNAIQAYEANDINFKKITSHYRVLCNMLTDGSTPFLDIFSTKQTNTDALLRADFAYVGSATNDQQLVAHLQTSTENLINTQLLGYSTILARQNILKQNYVFLEALVMAKIQQLKAAMAAAPVGVRPPIQVQIDDLSTELVIEKLIVDGIIEVINDIKLVHAKMAELNQSGFSQALYIAYRRITLANWQYISPSILGENDEVTVTMTVDAKEGTIPSPNYAMFNGKVKGMVYGFKLNFSTGLFMLAGKKLFDRTYRVDTIAGDPLNNIIVENKNRQSIQPAVGALMHFYMKRAGSFSWGGNFGFSISDQTKLNYHGGLSLMFGQEQRVIANIGIALTNVKEIGSAYEVGQKLTRSSGINTIPTENYYRPGLFAAITFNLSK